ncbi:transketolase [Planctomycetota bacterium]|nr:transketolase [Planctomycetota bacterium]
MPELTADKKTELEDIARKLRIKVVKMVSKAGNGHPGGSLGMADVFTALYFGGWMKHDPKNPQWTERDRLVLSNGHICPILYAALSEAEYFPNEWLDDLRQLGANLQGHPAQHKTPGVELSTGSLGHGVCGALGMSMALKRDGTDQHVWTLCGDGELQEGLPWEAFMAAGHHKADNYTVIVDRNDAQIDGTCTEVMNINPLGDKFAAFGFHVIEADGHSMDALFDAFAEAKSTKGKPTVIIAKTIMGKGVKFMEDDGHKWHGQAPNAEQTATALAGLGA